MNFDFIKPFPQLAKLYHACYAAEAIALALPAQSCGSARSALEFVVTLIYRSAVGEPESTATLFEKMSDPAFERYVNDETVLSAMHTVRKNGNLGAHGADVSPQVACETLEQLQFIVGELCINLKLISDYPVFVSPLDAAQAKRATSAPKPAPATPTSAVVEPAPTSTPASTPAPATPQPAPAAAAPAAQATQEPCVPSSEVVAEFAETLRNTKFSTLKHRDDTENKRLYVKASLREAEWEIATSHNQALPGTACLNMVLDDGSTIDCVLYGRNSRPLAVIDYTNAMANPIAGRKAAEHAAAQMEVKYGYKPTAYYVTGYRITCIDPLGYPPRRVFGFHTLDELELLKQRANNRSSITNPVINDDITNRSYQKKAIKAACSAFENKRRRSLIVTATGTGKTRVAISLVDVLTKANWVKNVLFLADRTSLVRQAHKNFNKLLPDMTTSIFTGSSDNRDKNARLIFATYQTMIRMVDGDTREFGIGRFDLIIVDEAHRSLFNKYARLFSYFDALMIGLTATPRCEEAKSTYKAFEIESGMPDYEYGLEEAINDGYLVGFSVLDRTTEGLRRGIRYDDLTDEQKQQVEEEFRLVDGDSDALNATDGDMSGALFTPDKNTINKGTIDVMLIDLMKTGVKINAGDQLGKTIIFTKNHREAEVVVERFNALYRHCGPEFCKLIDSSVDGAQSIIDRLGERDQLPQIAVSVDMLNTGIDIPDAVNLVFFRQVRSKIKFLQMVGRGTRLSPNLFGPELDKQGFLAFDYYDNFHYFNARETWTADKGSAGAPQEKDVPLGQSGHCDMLRLSILRQLQQKKQPSEFDKHYEQQLRNYFVSTIKGLNNDAIEVNQHLAYVNKYRTDGSFDHLAEGDVESITEHVLPLFPSEGVPARVKSFDALVLTVEDEYEQRVEAGKDPHKIRRGFKGVEREFTDRMEALTKLKNIPQVRKEEELIANMMEGAYLLDDFSLERAEDVRLRLRELMQYIPDDKKYYIINLPDQLIEAGEQEGLAKARTYVDRVNDYLADEHNVILEKLRTLEPLTAAEHDEIGQAFTAKLGTTAEYADWSGNSQFSLAFIRKQVGISQDAVNAKAGSIINDPSLTPQQKAYFDQMVSYARANGDIDAMTLQNPPFNKANVLKLFGAKKFKQVKTLLDILHNPVKPVNK